MAGKNYQCGNCGKQSLMSMLNTFVDAVNTMDEKVMVPSRLQDMELNAQSTNANNSIVTSSEENNNLAVLPFTNGRGEDLYSYYVMMNTVKNEILNGKYKPGDVSVVATTPALTSVSPGLEPDSDAEMTDSSSESGSEDSSTDTARKTAEAFRHHLQGLFGLLHQLTDTAKFLGDAYEEQIGGRKTKPFAI